MEMLGSGKCTCLNKDEKDKLNMSIFKSIQIFSERMREDIDPDIKESYKRRFLKIKRESQKYSRVLIQMPETLKDCKCLDKEDKELFIQAILNS